MSKGVVIIAKNPGTIDYVNIALWQARRIRKYLDLPTTIVTDKTISSKDASNVLTSTNVSKSVRKFKDAGKTNWINTARWEAFTLSPYEETILLDADYVVSTDNLLSLFNSTEDLVAFKDAYDVTGADDFTGLNNFGQLHIPMYWATVIYFRKTSWAKAVFEMMEMIERNYTHYAELYKFTPHPFRNDYALSIALNTLSGHDPAAIKAIPWQLATTTPTTEVKQISDTAFELHYKKNNKPFRVIAQDMDLHIMAKTYLETMADG